MLKGSLPFIPVAFHSFPPCGTMFPLKFLNCRIRGSMEIVGCDRVNRDTSISWTQNPPDLHQRTWLMRSVDFINEIEQSPLIGYPINRGATRGLTMTRR